MPIHVDAETRSTADLSARGAHFYFQDPSTDVLCLAYSLAEDDEPQLWVPGEPPPRELCRRIESGEDVHAHNAVFERLLFRHVLAPRYGFPVVTIAQSVCTMAAALAMSLPAALGRAAAAVGLPEKKDYDGRAIMLSFSSPVDVGACYCTHRKSDHTITKKLTRCAGCACAAFRKIEPGAVVWRTKETHPAEWAKLLEYCRQDVRTERALSKRLMPLSEQERQVYMLDQAINDRGVATDARGITAAIALAERESARLDAEMAALTGGKIETCNQNAKIAEFCNMPDGVARDEVESALAGADGYPDLSPAQRQVLELRQEAGRASVKKLAPMRDSACLDGRVRGLFQYHGAFTGRWAGRRVQPQNFPRPTLPYSLVEHILEKPETRFSPLLGKPLDLLANSMRSFLIAEPGHTLVSADLSQIEARMLAWMAGDAETIEAYRQGKDMYCLEATTICRLVRPYGYDGREITKKDSKLRQDYGKIPVLACGYQGGPDSFLKMGKAYGTDIQADDALKIVRAWREAHPEVVKFWYALESAAIQAVLNPGMRTHVGKITYRKVGSFLLCKLPSGRVIVYPYPRVESKTKTIRGKTFTKDTLTYQTVREEDGMWLRVDTYGGKLTENVVQAASRCVLSDAIIRVTKAGYNIVMHVHDEIIVEVLNLFVNDGLLKRINDIMAHVPDWAVGLPVASEGWIGTRYRK